MVVWAAAVMVGAAFNPFRTSHFLAVLVLASAALVQRMGTVQRFLTPSRGKRRAIQATVATAVRRLCNGRAVDDVSSSLAIHVWAVPFWYRRIFPYKARRLLHWLVERPRFTRFAKFALRPSLSRMAAEGLTPRVPSNVTFAKGVSMVGLALSFNDPGRVLALDTNDRTYREALAMTSAEWDQIEDDEITRGLDHESAKKLATRYGQVIAKVVTHLKTGEALGVVTIGVAQNPKPHWQVATGLRFRKELDVLTELVEAHLET